MTAVHLAAFRGTVPLASPRMIGDNFAQRADNCRLNSGRIEPIHTPEMVTANLNQTGAKTLYHYNQNGAHAFLTWQTLVDVARSTTVNDQRGRIFFTGDGEPRMTTLPDGIVGFAGRLPHAWYVLGVVAPTEAPSIAAIGGVEAPEDRAYRWTWVTQYDEESGPSPAVVASGPRDASWDITFTEMFPANGGDVVGGAPVGGGVYALQIDSVAGLAVGEEVLITAVIGLAAVAGVHKITAINTASNAIQFNLVGADAVTSATWARVAPHNRANIKRHIYRTTGTDTTYRRVATIDGADTNYSDTAPSTALFIALETTETEPPPKDLHSILAMPNGCLAGLSGNTLCLTHPYRPHSWPQAYRLNLPAQGVALGVSGNNVIVLTDSWPYMVTAGNPAAMSPTRMQTYAPCVAKAGVVDIGGALLYPSHDGMFAAAPSGVQNMTTGLFRRETWGKMFPESFVSAFHSGRYYARHANVAVDDSMMVLDLAEPDSIVDVKQAPSALLASPVDGELYLVKQEALYQWDKPASRPLTMTWQSKLYGFPGGEANFAVAQIRGDFPGRPVRVDRSIANAAVLAGGAAGAGGSILDDEILTFDVAGSLLEPSPPLTDHTLTFSVIDQKGAVLWSTSVADDEPFRITADISIDACSFRVTGTFSVDDIVVSETMEELQQVAA